MELTITHMAERKKGGYICVLQVGLIKLKIITPDKESFNEMLPKASQGDRVTVRINKEVRI